MSESIPLFPLNTVLFPGGPLKLRIFEARYLDMVGRCLREGRGFGVALIVEGREAGGPARTVELGTQARIIDFEQLRDGLLGITASGERRFRIEAVQRQDDGLNVADVHWLPDEPALAVPERHLILAQLLKQALTQIGTVHEKLTPRYDDATWVGMRLAEILPLPAPQRQHCLELTDAIERLDFVRDRLDIRQQ
jgi:uncharacterized protein